MHGGHDVPHLEVAEPADALQRVADLRLLVLELALVGEVLPAAAAAVAEVRARRLDVIRPERERLDADRLAVPLLDLDDARADAIAGQPAGDEDDDAIVPRDAAPTEGERVDRELELVTYAEGGSHVRRQGSCGAARGSPSESSAPHRASTAAAGQSAR